MPGTEELAQVLNEKRRLTCVGATGYAAASDGPRLVMFVGNVDGSVTGSWCPDCERAVPCVLESALDNNLPVIAVGVGERDDWKLDQRGASNPFRAKDGLALDGIPTLLLIGADGKEVARLGSELENAPTPSDARKIVDEAVAAHLQAEWQRWSAPSSSRQSLSTRVIQTSSATRFQMRFWMLASSRTRRARLHVRRQQKITW